MTGTLRDALTAQLQRFDDEAFVALANRGLLRRAQKDLEKQAASVVEESPSALTLAFGEHRIRFDARGPAHAQCSCPASGVCQHILAAALSLQRLDAPASPEAGTSKPADAPDLSVLQGELLRLTPAELTRHAGKPGYRWAWQFVQDMEPAKGLQISGDRNLVLAFGHPRIAFRYMGGGLDNLIADTELSQLPKYRVAAVLAFQRAHGQEPSAPEPTPRERNAALDLGADHALAEPTALAQHDSRERLRASVQQLLGECVGLGLSHLSAGIQERFSTLAVWAQGAEYHRLALLLRRLADHVELLLERAAGADEHRLLEEISLAHALVSALDAAQQQGAAPSHLVGRARQRYEQAGTLDLCGLGAHSWRSPSGYVGLTMLFWSPAQQAFLSCTDARPEAQRGFDPIARYTAPGPWAGLGAPAQAAGRSLTLQGAQLSMTGRLSAADSTSATLAPPASGDAFLRQLPAPASRWPELLQQREAQQARLLAEPQPLKAWALLKPKRFGPARFDGTRQVLQWPLFDEDDVVLNAELAFDEHTRHAIERIEQGRDADWPAGTCLVGRLQPAGGGWTVWPLSLVRPGHDGAALDALHFDAAPAQGLAGRLLDKLRSRTRATADAPPVIPATRTPAVLRELQHDLRRWAERGVAPEQAAALGGVLAGWAARTSDAGLTAFSRLPLATLGSGPVDLLRWHYLAMQHERLIDGPEAEAADAA